MDRSAPSFLVDRFRAGQVFYHTGKEAYRFPSRFLSRSFDSVSVISFAISEFRPRVYERFATVICPLSLLWAGLFLLSNIFSAAGGAAFRHGQFTVNQLLVGLPICFIWLFVEVGLVEEFFFRALIQSHLAAAFKSEVSGTVLMSLIFGLAHAPGFIFRHAGEVEGLRLESERARRSRLFDRCSGNKRSDVRCHLGANEKIIRGDADPRCRRSPPKFRRLRQDVALTSGAGFHLGDLTINRVEIDAMPPGR